MPSILAEVSFLTNPRDEKLLRRPEYRQKIAEALCHGVLRYSEALGGLNIAQRSRAPMVNRIHAPALESSENHASSSQ
jgi:N-acetylmuramoyl-L-alanine amidase